MTILERVLAAMKTSYAKYGFKKNELLKMADIISKNLKEESTDEDISATLMANEGFAQMMQSVYNRGVSETSEKYKGYIPKPKDPSPKEPVELVQANANQQAFTLDDVRKLVSEGIAEGLKPYKERDERNRLQSLLQGNAKLKDVPQKFRERYHLDKEEDVDKVANEIVNDWTAIQQGLVQSGKFVEAPKASDEASEDGSFRKMMDESAKRIQKAQTERNAAIIPQK